MNTALVPWFALAALWAILARHVKSDVAKEAAARRWAALAAYAAGFYLLLGVAYPAAHPAQSAIGLALSVVGCGFAAWARLRLASNWSGRVTLKAEHDLIVTGPYRVVRHPIYSGMMLGVIGTAIAQGSLLAAGGAALLLAVWTYKITGEEEMLQQRFGDQYENYRRRVRRLLPGMQ